MTREEAIAKINRLRSEYNDRYIDYCGVNEAVDMAIEALKAEPKHGRWIDTEDPYGFFDTIPVCSECGHITTIRKIYNYCSRCGAKMVEEE